MGFDLVVTLAAWKPAGAAPKSDRYDIEPRIVMSAACLTIEHSSMDHFAVNDAHQRTFTEIVISFDLGG